MGRQSTIDRSPIVGVGPEAVSAGETVGALAGSGGVPAHTVVIWWWG